MSRGTPPTTGRHAAVRVRTAKQRTASSARWLQRQLNDPYVQQAKADGWRSRAAYKLLQLNDRFHFLKPGQVVVDLGAAPGGWTQVALKLNPSSRVIALDILEMEAIPGVDILQMDFLADEAPDRLRALAGGGVDVVLSDMAAPTTGHPATDHLRIIALADAALMFACDVLNPGGSFVCKVFQGGGQQDFLKTVKTRFATVRHAKPDASRKESAEMYLVASGFRPVYDIVNNE